MKHDIIFNNNISKWNENYSIRNQNACDETFFDKNNLISEQMSNIENENIYVINDGTIVHSLTHSKQSTH